MTWLQALVALALFAPGVVAPRAHIEVWQLSMFSCAVFAIGIPASFWGGGRPASPRGHAMSTPFVNHARLPAISIPCSRDAVGLPFGLQLIARRGQDRTLLRAAQQIEAMLQSG